MRAFNAREPHLGKESCGDRTVSSPSLPWNRALCKQTHYTPVNSLLRGMGGPHTEHCQGPQSSVTSTLSASARTVLFSPSCLHHMLLFQQPQHSKMTPQSFTGTTIPFRWATSGVTCATVPWLHIVSSIQLLDTPRGPGPRTRGYATGLLAGA